MKEVKNAHHLKMQILTGNLNWEQPLFQLRGGCFVFSDREKSLNEKKCWTFRIWLQWVHECSSSSTRNRHTMGSLAPKIKRKTVDRDRGRLIASQREIYKICIGILQWESTKIVGEKKTDRFQSGHFLRSIGISNDSDCDDNKNWLI